MYNLEYEMNIELCVLCLENTSLYINLSVALMINLTNNLKQSLGEWVSPNDNTF